MKKIAVYCVLVFSLILGTNCIESNTGGEIKLVTPDEMQSILEMEDVQLIDVRTPEEFDEVRIVNAQNIDFSSPTFDEDIMKLDKSKPVILYCKSGGRSAQCAEKMKEAGFQKIYDLEGGISKWQHTDKLQLEAKS